MSDEWVCGHAATDAIAYSHTHRVEAAMADRPTDRRLTHNERKGESGTSALAKAAAAAATMTITRVTTTACWRAMNNLGTPRAVCA